MKKNLFMLMLLSVTLVSCEHREKADTTYNKDNTGINVRDRDANAKTSFDQSESEADRAITQKIRHIIVSDDSLSTNAKNIKIVTIEGVVTLRGPVLNEAERENIAKKVREIAGINSVDNQLEVTNK